ncbi:MAG: hypothetical protein K0R46_358 [Herbinix sp.]|jgi:hypothetical protein|nr:hypothetical protein [Herbinix sp.]
MQSSYVQTTLQAFADAIIPRTPRLAEEYGRIQYYGAIDLQIDQFLIYELEHYPVPMALPTAELLNVAATAWLISQGYFGRGSLATLAPLDRLKAVTMLKQQQVELTALPIIFQMDPELIIRITDALNNYTIIGYYSEWSGYGTTKLLPPQERVMEFIPISWKQVEYPGPSLGYRVLRPYRFDLTNIVLAAQGMQV